MGGLIMSNVLDILVEELKWQHEMKNIAIKEEDEKKERFHMGAEFGFARSIKILKEASQQDGQAKPIQIHF